MNLTAKSEQGYLAIRNSVALAEEPELRCLKFTGSNAFDVLDAICPCDLFLQDGQIKHTLLLNEDGTPFADVYACREGENAYLLGYGPKEEDIAEWIKDQTTGIDDFSVINLINSYDSLALDGPYAWELCAEVVGPDILGLPYLGMLMLGEVLIFRGGMTGEYGYHLLVPSKNKDVWVEDLLTAGKAFEMAWADHEARSQCVLENFFFDLKREGKYDLTPLELQLQWRLSQQKASYPGSQAIQALRKSGWNRRITCFITKDPVHSEDEITCEGINVGKVLAAGFSPLRGDYVGKALLNHPYWHAGLDVFKVGDQSLKTISAPAIKNLSLRVSPYRDSFHTRNDDHNDALER